MSNYCFICGAETELTPESEYTPGNGIVRCSNKYCANCQGYVWLYERQTNTNLSSCPICGNIVTVHLYCYSNYGAMIGCDNTSNCFTVADNKTEDAIRKWNNIAKIIGNRKE